MSGKIIEESEEENPVVFNMVVRQEALDTALEDNGIVPCHMTRQLVALAMKEMTWDFLTGCIGATKRSMEKEN